MKKLSTYRGFVIEWIDYMDCYRVYDIKCPKWTVVYTNDSIEQIKAEIDRQIFKNC